MSRRVSLAGALLFYAFAQGSFCLDVGAGTDQLRQEFTQPPDSARPWVLWYWMDGNVRREGITADLEAMQRVGLGGALIMDVTQDIPPGPVRFGSPQWRQMFNHAITEAMRLGLEVSMSNDAGWCGSGGPWITPDLAMQQVIWSQTNLIGPGRFDGLLPRLRKGNGFCRDIAVLAFPALPGDGGPVPGFKPKITASVTSGFDAAKLLDRNPATFVVLPAPRPGKPQYLQLEFTNAFTACQLKLAGTERKQLCEGELQVSDDGRTFRTLRNFIYSGTGLSLAFEEVAARYFRILFTKADLLLPQIECAEVELEPAFRLESFQLKTGLGRSIPPAARSSRAPAFPFVPLSGIVDLTSKTDPTGRLTWDVPKGAWTILRLGYMPMATENHPAVVEGRGLECDKLSQAALEAHFAGFLEKVISDAGGATPRTLSATHIDSWETGCQNWTPQFREEFARLRGYDLLRYLPAFSGRGVENAEVTDRFLWDIRRTIADLLADNYAGHLAELAHRHGMKLSIEAYGNGPFDNLLYAGRADVPMGEFWTEEESWSKENYDLAFHSCKTMACAAHTYGKPIVAAEAFTSWPEAGKWQNHPFSLKMLGDAAFCRGINRMVFQTYTHQPWLDRKPGMTIGQWGIHYERTETWWEQSRPWHQYLARCQYLLQRGLFVADVCYLTDEGAYAEPPSPALLQPPPPAGYDYDLAAPEVVLTRMSVKDGRIVLPDGMSYPVLVLPRTEQFTPKLLRKIKELADAGATIIGPQRATKSPSLRDYPNCDVEVRQMADDLWGATEERSNGVVESWSIGKKLDGLASTLQHSNTPSLQHSITPFPSVHPSLHSAAPLGTVLAELGVGPDFEQLDHPPGRPLHYTHRNIAGTEVYFVANPNPGPLIARCAFRVAGQQPELWHPDTGNLERAAVWEAKSHSAVVPLKLDPVGSIFVVFRELSTGPDPVVAVARNGAADAAAEVSANQDGHLWLLAPAAGVYELKTASGKRLQAEVKDLPAPVSLSSKWELHFPPGSAAPEHVTLDKLISWTEHRNPGVKYFSGAATYETTLRVPPQWIASDLRLCLDLGKVEVIAELSVNGQFLGILWKPPFQADVTQAIKAGNNFLQIKVVNLWPNRLIGDEQRPEDCQWRPAGEGEALAEWPSWLLQNQPSPTGRLTFTTWKHWHKDSPLLESGLLGPVTLHFSRRILIE